MPQLLVEEESPVTESLGDSGSPPLLIQNPLATLAAGAGLRGGGDLGTGTQPGGSGKGTGTSFFGASSEGDRFVYILDVSLSMNARQLRRARNEVLRSVDQLQEGKLFYVFLFSAATRLMFDESGPPTWHSATTKNKSRLRTWLRTIESSNGSDPQDALDMANGLKPSTIFLLSDGAFRIDSPLLRGNVQQHVAPIHTLMYEDHAGHRRMTLLARQSGGTIQYVPGPRDDYSEIRKRFADDDEEDRAMQMLVQGDSAIDHLWFTKAYDLYTELLSQFPRTRAAAFARQRLESEDWFDADVFPLERRQEEPNEPAFRLE